MNTTKQLEAVSERWRQLTPDAQAIAAAGFFGRIIGTSSYCDAMSIAKLLECLEIEVSEEEQHAAARVQAQQAAAMVEVDE